MGLRASRTSTRRSSSTSCVSSSRGDFDDVRIKSADWPAMKEQMPYGSLPVLEMPGGPAIAHSNAILVLIGRRYGLHPVDGVEAARHEGVMQDVKDLRAAVTPTLRMGEAEKKAAREALVQRRQGRPLSCNDLRRLPPANWRGRRRAPSLSEDHAVVRVIRRCTAIGRRLRKGGDVSRSCSSVHVPGIASPGHGRTVLVLLVD